MATHSGSDLRLRLTAYLDGELDPIAASEVERQVASDPSALHELSELQQLRRAFRSARAEDKMPERLRERIAGLAAPPRRASRSYSWQALAASAIFAALVGSGGTLGLLDYRQGNQIADAVVASHIRALMAPQPTDVLSSDRHTVKPWFGGKTKVAPIVLDLAPAGYPLIGGRLDIPQKDPLPVLVYKAGPHVVSVYVRATDSAPQTGLAKLDGFSILSWSDGGLSYSAVSDADSAELESFQHAFAAARQKLP